MAVPNDPSEPALSCRELNAFLADYLEAELAFDLHARFEAHLVRCVRCLEYLVGYRETLRLVRAVRVAPPEPAAIPDELVRAILDSRRAFA